MTASVVKIVMRDIPRLRSCLIDGDFLQMLYNAIEGSKLLRVRKAAYNIVLVACDGWLRSADLRQTLERFDFPKRIHSVVIETTRSNRWPSFPVVMEILSEGGYWHSYLRETMKIWLALRREGPDHALRIPPNVDELIFRVATVPTSTPRRTRGRRVPRRLVTDLTADRLKPLAKATTFEELLYTGSDRRAVLAVV